MIKAVVTEQGGEPVVVLGLDWTNLDRLADNRPIRFTLAELGLRPALEVWILGGPAGSIREDLAAVGLPVPAGVALGDGGLLAFFGLWSGRRLVEPLPVQVLGITTAADRALRAGATLSVPADGGRPGFRLLGDRSIDHVAAALAAGRAAAGAA